MIIAFLLKEKELIFLALVVYVYNVLITGPNEKLINEVKDQLHKAFTIKDLGKASYFLGVELLQTEHGLYVNQRKYILDILSEAGLTETSFDTCH